jgi:hypothetical protein
LPLPGFHAARTMMNRAKERVSPSRQSLSAPDSCSAVWRSACPWNHPNLGDRLRSAGMIVLSLLVPMVAAGAAAQNAPLGNLAVALNTSLRRHVDGWSVGLAVLFAATLVAAIHVVLGLVFDPRYKDFQLALFSGPVAALAIVASLKEPVRPAAGVAKWVAAGLTQRLCAVCGL